MLIQTILLFVLFCFIRNVFWYLYYKYQKYPNGVHGLPFVGCLLSFGLSPRQFLYNIGNKYGKIVSVSLGMHHNIFINDHNLLKKLYRKKALLNRPKFHVTAQIPQEFISLSGKAWNKRRKYANDYFITKMSKEYISSTIRSSLQTDLFKTINQKYANKHKLFYFEHDLAWMLLSMIWVKIFNCNQYEINKNDKNINKYIATSHKFIRSLNGIMAYNILVKFKLPNFLMNIIFKTHYRNALDLNYYLIEWMLQNGFNVDIEKNIIINKRIRTNKCYIDCILKDNHNNCTAKSILSDINALFQAGMDTTLSSMTFALILLSKYPDIQQQIYDEMHMKNIFGNDCVNVHFDLNKINELHIFRAFIHEALRIGNVAPFGGIPHYCSKQQVLYVDGKKVVIPKGTIIHNNSWYIHKTMYRDMGIHLEYWIDSETNKFTKNDKFVLFGVGKRDCLGKYVAMNVLYCTIGAIIIKYKLFCQDLNVEIKQNIGIVTQIKPRIGVYIVAR